MRMGSRFLAGTMLACATGMAGIGERPAFRGPLSFIYFCGCFFAPAPENLSASLPFDSNLEK